MLDEAEVNLVAGTNIIITPTINGPSIAATGGGTGTVTSVAATGGTGISVTGSPITTSGTLNIVNTAPDQTVVLTGAGTTAITGTYPSFTVTSNDAYVGTVTSVGGTGTVSGVTLTGTVTGSGSLTLGGTLAVTPSNFASQTANTVLIAPNGSAGTPTFRALLAADVPILNQNTTGSSGSCTGNAATASNVAYSGLTGTVPTWNQNTTGTAANVTGTVAVANGGTGTASPSLVAGTNVTISGSWPNQTVNSTAGGGGGGTVTSVSVVTANGVSGSVANPTTTPAITLTLGDISAATSKPSGGTLRSFTSRNGDVFNVKDYGALGDGSTNDITAIGNAIDAAITASGKLYFPAGVYVINNTITKTFGAVGAFYGLSIYGDGIGCSIIKQSTSNKGVFDLTCAGRSGCLTIENIGFWNNSGLSTVPCIKYAVSQEDNNDSHPNLRATNLFIGAQSGANSWTIGMDLYNIHNGYISGVQYYGDLAGGGTGIVFQKYGSNATAGTNKSMACFVQGSQFNLCNTGIKIKDSMESCLIQECLMVGVVYGVNSDYSIHLGVVNSHINCNGSGTGICIYGSGTGSDSGRLDQFICQGNLLYSQDANSTGISAGLNRSSINGNSFVSPMNSSGTKGIIITGGEGNNISGNSFSWHKVSYIEIASNYSLVSSNNATKGTALATNQYVNTGTGNNLVNNYYQT
jgi:hypothetical protein